MRLTIKIVSWMMISLVFSGGFFSMAVAETTIPDAIQIKMGLFRIHQRYTASGDHDQFGHRLKFAHDNTNDPTIRAQLAQIMARREELRPETVVTYHASSIPRSVVTPEIPKKKKVTSAASEVTTTKPAVETDTTHDTPTEEPTTSSSLYTLAHSTIDMKRLEDTRLEWVNDLRAERGRTALKLNASLHKTATDRSETMKAKGVVDHKRFADSGYYDYGPIEQRFRDRGLEFVNISRATFTENIGRGRIRCTSDDCTEPAIKAMRGVFDYYVSEEGTKYDAHWRTIIHPLYTIVGLGMAVNEDIGEIYFTTHYATAIKK